MWRWPMSEWLPEFCTHCQTIGHGFSSCRWLYARKDGTVHKEKIVQGKKPVPTRKQNWVPIKDNPSGIGSSLDFAAPQKNVDPVITETETHTITVQQQEIPKEPEQHATIVMDEPVQHLAIEDVSYEPVQHLAIVVCFCRLFLSFLFGFQRVWPSPPPSFVHIFFHFLNNITYWKAVEDEGFCWLST